MQRPALSLALAVLLALAGCSALQLPGESPPSIAPGVTEQGLANASALAAAHADSLRDGYTLNRTYVDRIPAHDDYRIRHATTTRVGPDFERFHTVTHTQARRNGTASEYTTETWSNGTVVFTRFANATAVRYERHRASRFPYGPSNLTHASSVRDLQDGTVTPLNGSRYRLTFDRFADGPRNRTGTGRAVFDDRGRVFEIRIESDFDTRVGRAHVNESIEWGDRGTTSVPRPDWLADAVAATAD